MLGPGAWAGSGTWGCVWPLLWLPSHSSGSALWEAITGLGPGSAWGEVWGAEGQGTFLFYRKMLLFLNICVNLLVCVIISVQSH